MDAMSRTFFVLSVKSEHFIIRWHHHCSLSTLILDTNCFPILHSVHESFPVFLPVFHRIKMHLALCISNRGERDRTSDLRFPKAPRYLCATPRGELSCDSWHKDKHICLSLLGLLSCFYFEATRRQMLL